MCEKFQINVCSFEKTKIETNEPTNGDCDFEYGWCGYSQAVDDDLNWLRRSKSTSRRPRYDHTIGEGESNIYIILLGQSFNRLVDTVPYNEKEKNMKCRQCQLYRERGNGGILFLSFPSRVVTLNLPNPLFCTNISIYNTHLTMFVLLYTIIHQISNVAQISKESMEYDINYIPHLRIKDMYIFESWCYAGSFMKTT